MSVSESEIAFALELFENLGPLTVRRMFGGMCLYHDNTVFAILRSDGAILLKAAGDFRDRVQADGWEHWTHTRKNGKQASMPYWRLPDEVLDDPDQACDLARKALAAL